MVKHIACTSHTEDIIREKSQGKDGDVADASNQRLARCDAKSDGQKAMGMSRSMTIRSSEVRATRRAGASTSPLHSGARSCVAWSPARIRYEFPACSLRSHNNVAVDSASGHPTLIGVTFCSNE